MKLSVSFLFFVAVFQFGTSNVLSKRDVQEELLLSDNNENGVQNENDVKMVKPGPLEVVLNNVNELIFGVCEQNCFGEFLVCFEGAIDGSFSTQLCDSKCGFYVNVNDQEEIAFMGIGARPKRNCTEMLMKNGITQQQGSNFMYPSCAPKIVNGIVKLNIMNATSDCVVSIKNAHIKVETTTAPPKTITTIGQLNQTSSGKNAASTEESGNFFDDYWWIFLILCIILIAVGVGIGIFIYIYFKYIYLQLFSIISFCFSMSKEELLLQFEKFVVISIVEDEEIVGRIISFVFQLFEYVFGHETLRGRPTLFCCSKSKICSASTLTSAKIGSCPIVTFPSPLKFASTS